MKKAFASYFLPMALIALAAASCSENSDPEPEPEPISPQRTVLVYMGANNNLGNSDYDAMDINEMLKGADDAGLGRTGRLLVYRSAYHKSPVLMEIQPGRIDTLVNYEYGTSASSATRMADVIASMKQLAPAPKYGIVIWGHGTGWLQDGMSDDRKQSYSYGPDMGLRMNTSTLASVLEDAACFDYIYFDCCFMASVETAYELRNAADYLVGSATELPAYGMNYSTNLPLLMDGSASALIESAKNTYRMYDSYTGMNRTCTMTVLNTDGLEPLADATRSIYSAAVQTMPEGYTPQRFTDYGTACYYFDFKDYVSQIADAASLAAFDTAFGLTVMYSAQTPKLWNSVDLSRHNGLSTYIIEDASKINTKNYNTLQWYKDVVSAFPSLK